MPREEGAFACAVTEEKGGGDTFFGHIYYLRVLERRRARFRFGDERRPRSLSLRDVARINCSARFRSETV